MTAHPSIRPREGVLDIAPYVGGESTVPGVNRVIKLSSNENPFGPSPKAFDAYLDAVKGLALYPDGGHLGLRRAIAEVHGLEAARIVCGETPGSISSHAQTGEIDPVFIYGIDLGDHIEQL